MGAATSPQSQALRDILLAELAAVDASAPDAKDLRLGILDRLAQIDGADRDFLLKQGEAQHAVKQWRSNTPLIIALTGAITIAANFLASYLLKDQQTELEAELARTTAELTEKNTRLQTELDEIKAESSQKRALQSREIDFQYAMIDRIMSADALEESSVEDVELLRARQLLFLSQIGLLSLVDKDALVSLSKEIEPSDGLPTVGFPTLPSAAPSASNLSTQTIPSKDLIAEALGPPGTKCDVPLVRVDVPFPMTLAWDDAQSVSHILVHEAAAPYFKRAIELVVQRSLQSEFGLFGGTFAALKIRGMTAPSSHAWGIAIDIDPAGNQLKWGRDRASMSHELARTMEEAGFVSIGLQRNFDWGHFELSEAALREIIASGYDARANDCIPASPDQETAQTDGNVEGDVGGADEP
jgi:D-alanyl-D-alanine carboxypeptidase